MEKDKIEKSLLVSVLALASVASSCTDCHRVQYSGISRPHLVVDNAVDTPSCRKRRIAVTVGLDLAETKLRCKKLATTMRIS